MLKRALAIITSPLTLMVYVITVSLLIAVNVSQFILNMLYRLFGYVFDYLSNCIESLVRPQ